MILIEVEEARRLLHAVEGDVAEKEWARSFLLTQIMDVRRMEAIDGAKQEWLAIYGGDHPSLDIHLLYDSLQLAWDSLHGKVDLLTVLPVGPALPSEDLAALLNYTNEKIKNLKL